MWVRYPYKHVLDILEAALDYEREVEWLDENLKGIVKLQEWAGDMSKVAGQSASVQLGFHSVCDAGIKILF